MRAPRHLLRIADLTPGELTGLLGLASRFKADPKRFREAGAGRVAGICFDKPSLRTRFSIESALARIGGHPIGSYDTGTGIGTREPLADAALVMSRYVDALVMRTHAHARVEELARHSSVPVINALSDDHHPLQALADLLTAAEHVCEGDIGGLKGLRLAYLGDGNNVAHSLIEAGALAGVCVVCACPPGYEPSPAVLEWARDHGGVVEVTDDPREAVEGAAIVYTDVWASMGQEDDAPARRRVFARYQVTGELMRRAAPGAAFLHCLPAHRGEEVEASVIDGPAARVFDQAENRMHTAAAVFIRMWSEEL